jgi:hypothetical protein
VTLPLSREKAMPLVEKHSESLLKILKFFEIVGVEAKVGTIT